MAPNVRFYLIGVPKTFYGGVHPAKVFCDALAATI